MKTGRIIPIGVGAATIIAAMVLLYFSPLNRARHTSASKACVNNLRCIWAAKEQASMEYHWSQGHDCDKPDNRAAVNSYIKHGADPTCPQGGIYTYNPVGTTPTCSQFNSTNWYKWDHTLPE